ncbi:3-oxoacyl-ACP synthase [Flagellimonas sp. HMM57]|uniref:3-oxoacyl-ACP synthase n=1 Tax=unclassified Flagellimonas TaxID=2644544 RepID=UPI0013D4C1D5|nr:MULTISPECIES: 3-oxoacyl-ACP synthase [unclassified Flagellimonas]UII77719.1 3-oxoacyl-ACP synthase [Flagellimonas sp. HMM57]
MKEKLLQFCWDYVNGKMENLQKRSDALQESLNSETKSSAGDKHETGRAMVQLEQEKLGKQLFEVEQMKRLLQKVAIEKVPHKVALGSLVKTSTSKYFISISAGEFKTKDISVFCVSPSSPISKALLGKETKEVFLFNGMQKEILEIS